MDDKNNENINKLELNIDLDNKTGEISTDTNSDLNMKSPNPQKNKINQMNQLKNHDINLYAKKCSLTQIMILLIQIQ